MYYIELSEHNLRHVNTFGSQHIVVECVAQLTAEKKWSDNEKYNIEYYRDPISGDLRSVICKPKEENETTENTLTPQAVQDIVWDFLQK